MTPLNQGLQWYQIWNTLYCKNWHIHRVKFKKDKNHPLATAAATGCWVQLLTRDESSSNEEWFESMFVVVSGSMWEAGRRFSPSVESKSRLCWDFGGTSYRLLSPELKSLERDDDEANRSSRWRLSCRESFDWKYFRVYKI